MDNTCYRIKNWNSYFENSHSRKCDRLSWVRVPTKQDGNGYRRVINHQRAGDLFAAWILIVQIASNCKPRGILVDGDRPLDADDLSFKSGFSAEAFQLAFDVLTDPRIGWLERIDTDTGEIPV